MQQVTLESETIDKLDILKKAWGLKDHAQVVKAVVGAFQLEIDIIQHKAKNKEQQQ